MTRPIAITMGDPAGIGPELIAALVKARPNDPMLIFGDASLFQGQFEFELLEPCATASKSVSLVHIACAEKPIPQTHNLQNAKAVETAIRQAVHAVQEGQASALLTAPISKENLALGNQFAYPGHTEFLGALDHKDRAVMLLAAEGVLRVVPTTIHCALKDVPQILNPKRLRETIEITARDLQHYLKHPPRIAVAGLNPHSGENGLMGTEERDWIAPLIKSYQDQGYQITGPHSADTLFHESARAQYDVAICMYHDQALIPIKTLAFDQGVNVTLGLSFLRTSPDHGTAYDIAGCGIANPSSFIAAYDLAKAWSA